VSDVALRLDSKLWDAQADQMSLMTLHASKGLEFAVLLLADSEDALHPLRSAGASTTNLDEDAACSLSAMPEPGTVCCSRLPTAASVQASQSKCPRRSFLMRNDAQLLKPTVAAPSMKKPPARQQLKQF